MDNLCDRLLSTIIGEFGIIKVLESKSYTGSFCSCPGCTCRG